MGVGRFTASFSPFRNEPDNPFETQVNWNELNAYYHQLFREYVCFYTPEEKRSVVKVQPTPSETLELLIQTIGGLQ